MGWWDWLFKTISRSAAGAPVERCKSTRSAAEAGAVALSTAPTDTTFDRLESESDLWWTPKDHALLDPVDVRPAGGKQSVQFLENILVSHFDGHDLTMPQLNNMAEQILPKLRGAKCDLKTVGREIAGDQLLSAAVLRTANSPMFRGVANTTTVPAAVTRIGIKSLRTILLHQSVRSAIFTKNSQTKYFANILWRKSLADACVMRGLAGLMRMDEDDCHLIGLMHDIGSVLVLRIMNDQMKSGCPSIDHQSFEYLRLQTHQEFGELIAKAWQLPPDLSQLIMNHHSYPTAGDELATQRWMLILTEMIGAMLYSDEPPNYDLIQCRPASELELSARMEYHDWLSDLPSEIDGTLQFSDG